MTRKIVLLLLVTILPLKAFAISEITDLLKNNEAPSGVVIEITSGDPLYLKKIMPELIKNIKQLQEKFTNLPVAIVSHARESLLLSSKETQKYPAFQNQIKSLANDANTTVHVCGTYASWYNLEESDFPEYINVSPAGPVQVDDYIELGYTHIEL